MISENRNIIQKTFVDFEYNGVVNAFDLQKKITDWSGHDLVQSLENVLEQINTHGAVIRIDKLELDIETDGNKDWLEDLVKKISRELDRQLHEKDFETKNDLPGPVKKSRKENFFEAFVFFLQHGILPWWSLIKEQKVFFTELEQLTYAGLSDKMKQELTEVFKYRQPGQRMIWQLPEPLFYDLLKQVFGQAMSKPEAAIAIFEKNIPELSLAEERVLKFLWKKNLLKYLIDKTGEYSEEKIIDSFICLALEERQAALLSQIVSQTDHPYLKEKIAEKLHTRKMISPGRNEQEEKPDTLHTETTQPLDITKEERVQGKPVKGTDEKKEDLYVSEMTEGLYINNAGLVIVAAFLPMFFKKLSLVEGDMIKDKNKAALLVQWLASGKEHIAEFELGLAKILCGLDMQTPVDTTVLLTTGEKEEASELLLSVIEYWSVLKNTSVDGLRESFLLRKGKLSVNEKGWLLQVEQKSYDMLLQQLPWNISMIKLPWMKNILKTEWV